MVPFFTFNVNLDFYQVVSSKNNILYSCKLKIFGLVEQKRELLAKTGICHYFF